MDKNERNKLLIGIGIGLSAGFGTGYIISRKRTEKKCREEMKKVRKKAYIDGFDRGQNPERIRTQIQNAYNEGYEKGMQWIDNFCVIPEEGDTPEQIQEKLKQKREAIARMEEQKNESSDEESDQPADEHKTSDSVTEKQDEQVYSEPDDAPVKVGMADYDRENGQIIFLGAGGTRIAYPSNLFIGPDGNVLDSIDIRNNIRKHEHNRARLNLIWNQMGWGSYIPDLDNVPSSDDGPDPEEINNWDLRLDGDIYSEPDTMMGDEPEEKTIERERYLDEVNRYISNPEEAPRIISRREYDEECYLEKIQFDYYDVDNKFVESTDVDNEIGPYDYFGITDGQELFSQKNDPEDDDPDVVYVKNFKLNCVIEVTRWHKAYESIKDGGAYVQDGGTD